MVTHCQSTTEEQCQGIAFADVIAYEGWNKVLSVKYTLLCSLY